MRKKWVVRGVLAGALVIVALGAVVAFKRPRPDLASPRLIDFLGVSARVRVDSLNVKVRVAVTTLPGDRRKEQNLREIESICRSAKRQHPDLALVVFAESSLGLYHDAQDPVGYQRRIAEPVPGPSTRRLGALAGALHIHIALGLVESEGDRLYNSLVVLAPSGEVIARHRKMLLHYLDERSGITEAAPNAQTFDIGGLRFGLSICADANSPRLVDEYRARNIDALVYSVTSKVPFISIWLRHWPYSKLYGSWILTANRYGTEGAEDYPGTAFVSAPNGHIQAVHAGGAGYVSTLIGR